VEPDVIVIGAGPAGTTAATLLAQRGRRVCLIERERFPRFHIGESLMPETYWTLRRLNMLDRMKASPFVKKYSVQFVDSTGKEALPFYFFEANPHESSQTWQVLRSEFDQMLVENAASHGVEVRQGVRVLDVLFDGDQAHGVRIQDENGQHELCSSIVVDASGQSSLIANRLKLREPDPFLKKAAIWTYFADAHRDSGLDEGATLVLYSSGKNGWFWYIPLHGGLVSIGVVASIEYLLGRKEGVGSRAIDPAAIFAAELERCPAAKRRIARGRRVSDFYTTKDFSYRARRVAGDGWVLVGDALGFLDPIYSSGVFLALKSGEMAADAVADGLDQGDTSAAQLGRWGPTFLRGMERMQRLVYAFYEGFSFGQFVRRHPRFQRHIVDLLTGNLFRDSIDEVWGPMAALQREMTGETRLLGQ
jgi:flavin-dependent dehydrogenase